MLREKEQPWMQIEDNGDCGDGIDMSFHRGQNSDDDYFASISLSVPSLRMVIAALTSILTMREAQCAAETPKVD